VTLYQVQKASLSSWRFHSLPFQKRIKKCNHALPIFGSENEQTKIYLLGYSEEGSYVGQIMDSVLQQVQHLRILKSTAGKDSYCYPVQATVPVFENCIHEDITSQLISGNACYYSVQILHLPVCYSKIQRLRYIELHFCLLFCTGVKTGLSHSGWNIAWGFSRIWYWGKYLGLRGTRWQGSREDCIKRSFVKKIRTRNRNITVYVYKLNFKSSQIRSVFQQIQQESVYDWDCFWTAYSRLK
jgi:hypothetical protein